MNLANILTRKSPMKRAFVTLESGMDDVLTEEFMLPEEPGDAAGEIGEAAAPGQDAATDRERLPRAGGAETAEEAAKALDEPAGDRLTNHAQGRLSAVAAFDEGRSLMQRELEAIGSALARIVQPVAADARRSLISGVLPMASRNPSRISGKNLPPCE